MPLSFLRLKPGLKLTTAPEWSIVGKRTAANTSENIMKKVQEIMQGVLSTNLEKVTRMTHYSEVFYCTQYGKLKTCGYCVEYGREHMLGEVQYFLYSASLGNAVAVIHPLKRMSIRFETQVLNNGCLGHIKEVVRDNR